MHFFLCSVAARAISDLESLRLERWHDWEDFRAGIKDMKGVIAIQAADAERLKSMDSDIGALIIITLYR